MPSMPICTSMIGPTPLCAQMRYSLRFIRREASSISGCAAPSPAQNNRIPAPVPVDSITGALASGWLATKVSATSVVNG
jgi:hypothetical protein